MGSACAKKDHRAPPRGYINRWSGTEVGLAYLGAPNLPIIVGLASLLIIYSPKNSRQGAGYILSKMSAVNNEQKQQVKAIEIVT